MRPDALPLLVADRRRISDLGLPNSRPRKDFTGALIDVWLKKNAEWPLAVIYDAAGNYTCSIDRGHAGHDPLRPCSAGEKCRVTGTYRILGVGEQKTYSIQTITDIGGSD
jgi:hypothetical protein